MLKFGTLNSNRQDALSLYKLKFALVSTDGKTLLEFIFNSDFGIRILNYTVQADKKSDFHLDIDLDFARTTKQLFLVVYEGKVFITVNYLSFADVIFKDDLRDPFAGVVEYQIIVDQIYTSPSFLQDASVAIIATSVSNNLADQLNVISYEGDGKIDLTAKLYFKTTYKNGSNCDHQPRQTQVVYYCD